MTTTLTHTPDDQTAHDVLRRAADLLRTRAADVREVAKPGRWHRHDTLHAEPYVHAAKHPATGHIAAPGHGMPDYGAAVAEHVAALDPDVALVLADLLHGEAVNVWAHGAPCAEPCDHDDLCESGRRALAVARTYLREPVTS